MLFIVATPIGNLSDITYRAIDTLKKCDYILCEDTRHSLLLLHHYDIHKPLKSFHKFSETEKETQIIADIKGGALVALISDAGTPGISDPGAQLITACREQEVPIIAIPGACAAITALCSAGLPTDRFQFCGFIPRKTGEQRRFLQDILAYPGTSICYESPNRLCDTLSHIDELDPNRLLVVARELTKKFEEVRRGTAKILIESWKNTPVKGEIVLLFDAYRDTTASDWQLLTPQQHVEWMEATYHLTKQEAIIAVAKMRGVSKRDIYNIVHRNQ